MDIIIISNANDYDNDNDFNYDMKVVGAKITIAAPAPPPFFKKMTVYKGGEGKKFGSPSPVAAMSLLGTIPPP